MVWISYVLAMLIGWVVIRDIEKGYIGRRWVYDIGLVLVIGRLSLLHWWDYYGYLKVY